VAPSAEPGFAFAWPGDFFYWGVLHLLALGSDTLALLLKLVLLLFVMVIYNEGHWPLTGNRSRVVSK
jgi:uncharacterized membrane protein